MRVPSRAQVMTLCFCIDLYAMLRISSFSFLTLAISAVRSVTTAKYNWGYSLNIDRILYIVYVHSSISSRIFINCVMLAHST